MGNRTNQVVRRLTYITTIFMPLSFFAGVGGMSEWSMMTGPENWRIAYPAFLAGMGVIGVISYFILAWLDRRSSGLPTASSFRYLMRCGWSASAPEPAVPVGLVVLVVALEPDHLAVALEGEHVRGDAVEEPAVVADDDHAAGEVEQRVLERAQRVDVEVVGRLVEQQQVAAAA